MKGLEDLTVILQMFLPYIEKWESINTPVDIGRELAVVKTVTRPEKFQLFLPEKLLAAALHLQGGNLYIDSKYLWSVWMTVASARRPISSAT